MVGNHQKVYLAPCLCLLAILGLLFSQRTYETQYFKMSSGCLHHCPLLTDVKVVKLDDAFVSYIFSTL